MPAPKLSSRAKALILAGVLAGIGLAVLQAQDLVLYNPSPSIAPGFYIRADQPIERALSSRSQFMRPHSGMSVKGISKLPETGF